MKIVLMLLALLASFVTLALVIEVLILLLPITAEAINEFKEWRGKRKLKKGKKQDRR